MTRAIRATFLAVSCLLAGPALAQDGPTSSPPASTELACTNAGTSYSVGDFACIAACHQQRRLARCDSASGKASWTYVSDACPSAMINAPWPATWSEIPAVTVMSPRPVVVTRSERPAAVSPEITFKQFALARVAAR